MVLSTLGLVSLVYGFTRAEFDGWDAPVTLSLRVAAVALVLPGQVLVGLGMGMAFMPAMSLATYGIEPRDAGVASAMANTAQQVGGAIGTALLNTLAAGATTRPSCLARWVGPGPQRMAWSTASQQPSHGPP